MERQFSSTEISVALLLTLLIVFKMRRRSKMYDPEMNWIPGPRKLPLIGNMHQLAGSLPHRRLTDLAKKYGAIMRLQLGEVSTIVISSSEFAKEVMKTHDLKFAYRPVLLAASIILYDARSISFSPYGDYWRKTKKISVLELLNPRRVQSFRSVREEEVAKFITCIHSNAGSPVNLSKKIFSMTYAIVSRAAFGRTSKDQEEFISLVNEAIEAVAGFSVGDLFPSCRWLHSITRLKAKFQKIHLQIDRILEKVISEHKARKATSDGEQDESLLDALLHFQEHGDADFPFANDNIKAVILDIFGAGSETSSTTVEWAMSEILKNPRVLKRTQEEVRQVFNGKTVDETGLHELKFLKLVIKEAMRLHPAAPLLLPRQNAENCEIGGYHIPAKTRVMVNAWAIGRDPKYWTKAEEFFPERFLDSSIDYKGTNFEYLPFGAGRRMCPGMEFGIANVELPLASLLYHFDWKLQGGVEPEDLDMTEGYGATVRRQNDLYLIPIPYHHVPSKITT